MERSGGALVSVLWRGASSDVEEVRLRVRLGLSCEYLAAANGKKRVYKKGNTHGREPNMDLGQFPPGEMGGEFARFFFSLSGMLVYRYNILEILNHGITYAAFLRPSRGSSASYILPYVRNSEPRCIKLRARASIVGIG